MGRAPCCEKMGLKKGPWTQEEDQILINYIRHYGHTNWRALPKQAGLLRCGKSCRLRWINYLRPDIKRGNFTIEEEDTVIKLHQILGNRWSAIAAKLPGRTDNEIKNVWHTHLKKRLIKPNNNPKNQETLKKEAHEEDEESAQEIASSPQQPSSSTETSIIVTEKINNNNGDRDLKDNGIIKTEYFRLSDDSTVTDESFWTEVILDDQLYGSSLTTFPLGKITNNISSESSLNVFDHDLEFWHGIFTGNGELLGMPEM